MNTVTHILQLTIERCVHAYTWASNEPWWPVLVWAGGFVGTAAGVLRAWVTFKQYLIKKKSELAAKKQDEDMRLKWFNKEDFIEAQSDYVVPFCSNIDPSDRDDLRTTVAVREPVFGAILREINAGERRHILVLADSGMGKTTLLLNLVAREQGNHRIAMIPLSQSDAIEHIKSIKSERETILLLDAFDEDTKAIENVESRMAEIMLAAEPFKCTIMTCRTQFFPSDEKIPRHTGIKRVAARRAGAPIAYSWRTIYLQPFDQDQISQYIKRTIPWYRRQQRLKAESIVRSISDLAARPMLTALIPRLAGSKREAHSLWDLYAFMVDTWIDRESSWISAEVLRRTSKSIAMDLILNRGTRGSERVPRTELLKICESEGKSLDSWQLTSRSLLNRDSEGNYKFAHRSILEYFFIEALLDLDLRCLSVPWTDMMSELFLSWGSSEYADENLANKLLLEDFSTTGLFPIAEHRPNSSNSTPEWIKLIFSNNSHNRSHTNLPPSWRSLVTHLIEFDPMTRVYDFADGLVWQISSTTAIADRAERSIYKCNNFQLNGTDNKGRDWNNIEIGEIGILCDILEKKGKLFEFIDSRELYWLTEPNNSASRLLARIRPSTAEQVAYPNLEHIGKTSARAGEKCVIDFYQTTARRATTERITALSILVYFGNAETIYTEDKLLNQNLHWGIARRA